MWDFSGYEPYYMLYDHFLGDVHCVHAVIFNLEDSLDEQMAQVVFWLNFLKARIHPKMPIGEYNISDFPIPYFTISLFYTLNVAGYKTFTNKKS